MCLVLMVACLAEHRYDRDTTARHCDVVVGPPEAVAADRQAVWWHGTNADHVAAPRCRRSQKVGYSWTATPRLSASHSGRIRP